MNSSTRNTISVIEQTAAVRVVKEVLSSDSAQRGVGQKPREVNGPKGLEPTRYGDWEKNGRCIDF